MVMSHGSSAPLSTDYLHQLVFVSRKYKQVPCLGEHPVDEFN